MGDESGEKGSQKSGGQVLSAPGQDLTQRSRSSYLTEDVRRVPVISLSFPVPFMDIAFYYAVL